MSLIKVERAKLDVKPPAFLSLLVIIAFASINAIFYSPGLPAIGQTFDASPGAVKMTMTVFVLGYAFGQLIYGPLANRYGRKPALYIGISAAALGNLLCALSGLVEMFWLLLAGRVVSALGASVGLTMAFTIVGDFYYEADARRVISYATIGFAAVPGIAIALGGALIDWLGWESAFYFMVLYSLFGLVVVWWLPETGTELHPHATKARQIANRYLGLVKDIHLMGYSLIAGLCTAMIYMFSTAAPFIAIQRFGLSEWEYGVYFLIPAAALVFSSLLSGKLAHHQSARRLIGLGILLAATGTLLLIIFLLGSTANVLALFLPTALAYFGCPLMYSNAAAYATSEASDKASASSVMNFVVMGTAVLGVFLLSLISTIPGRTLPYLWLGAIVFISFLFVMLRRPYDPTC